MALLDQLYTTTWLAIGPAPIDTPGIQLGLSAGRIVGVAMHPRDENTVYVAADGGGIWKTTTWREVAPRWTPLTDDQMSLNVGGYHTILVPPAAPDTVIAACNIGVLRSDNAGQTWTLLGEGVLDQGGQVGSVAADPNDDQVQTIYAAVWPEAGNRYGVRIIQGHPCGSQQWTNINPPAAAGCGATDVIIARYDSNTLLAAFVGLDADNAAASGVYRSTNGGASWKLLTTLASGTAVGGNTNNGNAISLDSAVTAGHAYAAYLKNEKPADPSSAQIVERARTNDGGDTWHILAPTSGNSELRPWHLLLAVDPGNPAFVLVNDQYELWGSLDSGRNWTRADDRGTEADPNPIGYDWVTATFDAAAASFVLACDQGVADGGELFVNWRPKSSNLQVTELYSITPDPTDSNVIYGTGQDQGAAFKFGGQDVVWRIMARGSELGKVLVDPNDGRRIYVADYNVYNNGTVSGENLLSRTEDGGQTWVTILDLVGMLTLDWYTLSSMARSVVLDPGNASRILVGGRRVWETSDATAAKPRWTQWPAFPAATASNPLFVTGLATAGSSPATVYAATAALPATSSQSASQTAYIYQTTNSGQDWTEISTGLPASGGWAIDVQTDPQDATTAYLVGWYGLYKLATVSETPSWTQVPTPSGVQVWSVYPQWSTGDLYLGTSDGVWWSTNNGSSWHPLGDGMPHVTVRDLQPIGSSALCAATYGRGAWAIELGGKTRMISVPGERRTADLSARPSWIAFPGWRPGQALAGVSEPMRPPTAPRTSINGR